MFSQGAKPLRECIFYYCWQTHATKSMTPLWR